MIARSHAPSAVAHFYNLFMACFKTHRWPQDMISEEEADCPIPWRDRE